MRFSTLHVAADELDSEILNDDGRINPEFVEAFVGMRGQGYGRNSGFLEAMNEVVAARLTDDGYGLELDLVWTVHP